MKVLNRVQSICPQCHRPVEACYIEEKGSVYLRKSCSDHGDWETLVAQDCRDYIGWMKQKVVNVPPKRALTQGSQTPECPLHCGTCTNHLQTACCVLIDLTQRCNQHCPYCFASADEGQKGEPDLEEIEKKYDLLLELGEERKFNIQLSGGEPTLRDDLTEIVAMAKKKGFPYVQVNSNGKRLGQEPGYAQRLKEAGVSVVFMQYDGTTDTIHQKLRRENLKAIKEKAIEECRRARLPVTLVPTVVRGVNLDNVGAMMDFVVENLDVIKGIHFQPVSYFGRYPEDQNRVTLFDVLHELERQVSWFDYNQVAPIAAGHPLCCFHSSYTKLGKQVVCQSGPKKSSGRDHPLPKDSCCDDSLSCGVKGTVVDGGKNPETIQRVRDYILNRWDMGEAGQPVLPHQMMDFDQFIHYYKQNSFTVTGMAFQDLQNLDGERVKRCRVIQLTEDNRMIPFCAYNSIYRGGNHA